MERTDLNVEVKDADELMANLSGARIKGGMETPNGLHVYLDGGRTLIFTGEFVIAIYRGEETVVH